jgi:hypothetical protein
MPEGALQIFNGTMPPHTTLKLLIAVFGYKN